MDNKNIKNNLEELELEIEVSNLKLNDLGTKNSNNSPVETLDFGGSNSNNAISSGKSEESLNNDVNRGESETNLNNSADSMQDISDDNNQNNLSSESNNNVPSNANNELASGSDDANETSSLNNNKISEEGNLPSSSNENYPKQNDNTNNKKDDQKKPNNDPNNKDEDSNKPNNDLNNKNDPNKNPSQEKKQNEGTNNLNKPNNDLNNNKNDYFDKQNSNNQPQKSEPKENKAIDNKRNEAKKRNENLQNKKPNSNNPNNGAKSGPNNKGNKNFVKNYAKNYAKNKLNNSELGSKITNAADKVQKAKKTVNVIKNIKNIKNVTIIGGGLITALPIILAIIGAIMLVGIIMAIFSPSGGSGTVISGYSNYTDGFYCNNITVGGTTYELEEYVARVIAQELGGANTEGLKAQAVLARTFVLNKTKNGKCTIGNSENEQTLKTGDINEKYRTAANATKGEVLTHNGKLTGAYYATFPNGVVGSQDWGEGGCGAITCQDGSCTTKFYKYPSKTAWNITLPEKNKSGNYWNGASLQNQKGHCHGASQLGIMYYDEQGKKYNEILSIFFDSDVKISKLESAAAASGTVAYQGEGTYKKQIIYYNQTDYKTTGYCGRTPDSSYYYGCKNNTICSSGCGGTSLAMIVSTIKGDTNINPITIMQYIKQHGGCGARISGSTIAGLVSAAKTLGLTAYSTTDKSDVAKKLSTGEYLAIANVAASEFTSTGHYIVLSGYRSGEVFVIDPNGGEKTSMPNSIKLLSKLTSRDRNGWWKETAVFDHAPNGYIVIGEK